MRSFHLVGHGKFSHHLEVSALGYPQSDGEYILHCCFLCRDSQHLFWHRLFLASRKISWPTQDRRHHPWHRKRLCNCQLGWYHPLGKKSAALILEELYSRTDRCCQVNSSQNTQVENGRSVSSFTNFPNLTHFILNKSWIRGLPRHQQSKQEPKLLEVPYKNLG